MDWKTWTAGEKALLVASALANGILWLVAIGIALHFLSKFW